MCVKSKIGNTNKNYSNRVRCSFPGFEIEMESNDPKISMGELQNRVVNHISWYIENEFERVSKMIAATTLIRESAEELDEEKSSLKPQKIDDPMIQ